MEILIFEVMRELRGTMRDAGSRKKDTAITGHRLPVTLRQKFSTNPMAWLNGCFLQLHWKICDLLQ